MGSPFLMRSSGTDVTWVGLLVWGFRVRIGTMRGPCCGVSVLVVTSVVALGARQVLAQAPPPAYPSGHDAYPPAYPPQSYPPPTFPAPNPYQLQPPELQGPVVHLRADNPRAQLQQLQLRWRTICLAPCGRPADPAGYYRIGGDTIRPSAPFRLPRASGEVLIDTQVGSNVKHWLGLGLGIGGLVAATYGAVYLAFGEAISADSYNRDASNVGHTVTVFGLVIIGIGVALGIVGLNLWSSKTSVDVR